MILYKITGKKETEYSKLTFGYFTTKELAEKGWEKLPEEIRKVTEVAACGPDVNTLAIEDKTIDLTAAKSPMEVLEARDKDNYVEGYVKLSMSYLIHHDYENFLDMLSEKLTGSCLLMDIDYKIAGFTDDNEIILKVSGDAAMILEEL